MRCFPAALCCSAGACDPMRRARRRGYRELLIVLGIFTFGHSIAAAFYAVYLSGDLGLSPAFIASLYGIGFFVAALGSMAFTVASSVPATPAMVGGIGCLVVTELALALLEGPPLYLLFSILFGASIPLFFLPWNSLLAAETHTEDRGAKFGGINLAFALASVGAPFAGGLVAERFGFRSLFLLSAVALAGSAVVTSAFARRGDRVGFGWNLHEFGPGMTAAILAQGGIEGILSTAIPLTAFAFVQGKVELGALFALFALTGGVFSVVLGRISDRIQRRRRFIALGVAISLPIVIAVGLAPTLPVFAVANGALAATLAVAPMFVFVIATDRMAGRIGPLMATREAILNLSRGVAAVGVLIAYATGLPVQLAILLVAILLPLELLAS